MTEAPYIPPFTVIHVSSWVELYQLAAEYPQFAIWQHVNNSIDATTIQTGGWDWTQDELLFIFNDMIEEFSCFFIKPGEEATASVWEILNSIYETGELPV